MPTYRVNYYFNGYGHMDVVADNEDEAMDAYYDGAGEYIEDDTQDYELNDIELISPEPSSENSEYLNENLKEVKTNENTNT